MDFNQAKRLFLAMTEKLQDEPTTAQFKQWVRNWGREDELDGCSCCTATSKDPSSILDQIAADLRGQLPMEALLPSETITFPKTGEV